ncbi:MAG: septal ring lytic transglycosylase RlpA family protein, partial [Xanthomonadales bacterium]|nr:septal ring lytic transglycosylase RlpA family protein [Xanthomonadales bacterium]
GEPFHGRLTSNQEIYDMYKLTAAHKSLPLPTYAEVTNLENNRTIVVRINDRGPFKDDRIIDLSYAAARELGMVEAGTALVRVKALVPEDTAMEEELVITAENLYLQLGAFSERDNALALVGRLRDGRLPPAQIVTTAAPSGRVHRVRIGPLEDSLEADMLIAELLLMGLERPVVIFE